MNKFRIVGVVIGLIGFGLAWIFFSWKLCLILMLVMWGNNIERKFDKF